MAIAVLAFVIRFRFLPFLIVFLLMLTGSAHAQGVTVTGRAIDGATRQPLIGATVQLIHLPDSARRGAAADVEGNFRFDNAAPGAYVLAISFLSYRTSRRPLTVADQPVVLGDVRVRSASVQLGQAEVVGRTPPVIQKGDTSQYNAAAYKTNPDADARDLITKMPGVSVGTDGKVSAQGEQVQRVLVDGKQFFGNDPDAVLRNIPAEAIDKVQVFDRQSDQSQFTGFDDGNAMKTINLVTKPQFRSGQFGRIVAGGGPERYKASVSLNSFEGDRRVSVVAQSNNVNEQNFSPEDLLGVISASQSSGGGGGGRGGMGGGGNGGPGGGNSSVGNFLVNQRGGISTTHAAGINYTDKLGTKTEVQAAYFFNYTDNLARTTLARQFVLPGATGQRYDETSTKTNLNQNHRVSLRLEHKFDSVNSILWTPRATWQLNESTSDLLGRTNRPATDTTAALSNAVQSNYTSKLTGINLGGELLYRHRFALRGRSVSVSATPSYNSKTGPSTLRAGAGGAEVSADTLNQRANLDQSGWGISTNVVYTEPLGKKSQLQANYAFSYAPNSSDKKTYAFDPAGNQYTLLDTTLSSVFTNQYVTHGVGLGYRFNDREKQFGFGVTGQRADLSGDQTFPRATDVQRTFWNVLPNAQARLKFGQDRSLRLNYMARTNAPSISQLQEVVNNANPLQLTTGNPNLQQEFSHNLFARYSSAKPEKGTSFFLMMGGSATQNNITSSTLVATRRDSISPTLILLPGTQLTRPVNLDGQYSLRSFATFGFPLKALKSTLNLNASGTYTRTPGLVNNALNYARSPMVGGGLTLSSNISERLDFALTSNTAFTSVSNTLRKTADNQYVNQTTSLRLSWIVGPGISFQTDVSHQLYSGLSAGFDQNYVLWNASVGKKFLNNRGEAKLYVFDILKQNNAIQRTITEAYQEDQRTNILQRYAMVMLTWNIRKGTGAPAMPDRGPDGERRHFRMGERPAGFGPPPGQ